MSIWESEDDLKRFRDERLMPAVREAISPDMAQAEPPPTESFEAKHISKS